MSTSSYDDLMKHLLCLKAENSHLHRELQINSSHLTKLELDASTMKDRLAYQLHYGTMDESGVAANTNHLIGNGQDFDRMTAQKSDLSDAMQYSFCFSEEEAQLAQPSSYFENSSSSFQVSDKSQSNCPMNHQYYQSGTAADCTAGYCIRTDEHGFTKHDLQNSDLDLSNNLLDSERTVSITSADHCEVGTEIQAPFGPQIRWKAAGVTVEKQEAPTPLSSAKRDINSSSNQTAVNGQNGPAKLITIATQTNDVCLPNSSSAHDGFDWQNTSGNQTLSALYHGGWPLKNDVGDLAEGSFNQLLYQDTASVMSFASSFSSSTPCKVQQFGTKVEMVYSLLSMLGTHDKDDMSRTLLAMSNSQDSCIAMRQSGCIPLLIQLLHGSGKNVSLLGDTRGSRSTRTRAATALHNIVHSNPEIKSARRERQVLHILEQIRAYCDQLHSPSDEEDDGQETRSVSVCTDLQHLVPFVASLMKLSFHEEHRQAICNLGGLQAVAELIELDQKINGNTTEQCNIAMRRYACMTLTNLTFADSTNKALMCSHKGATRALALFLHSPNEDLRQVSASVLRNLSWRADPASKQILREVGSVVELMLAAMRVEKESTLKSILSALWNLSAHSSENKEDLCAVDGALKFLVSTLTYQSSSNAHAVIEHGGGVLRNISSHIAVHEKYRAILRQHGCLQILLRHLESPSLGIVSNACGTLWNLSARCPEDQSTLWELGAVSKLRNLVNSKHKMISMGSAAALKNLIMSRSERGGDERTFAMTSPALHVRRQRTLETELDDNIVSETFVNSEGFRNQTSRSRSQESQIAAKFTYLQTDGESNKTKTSFVPKVPEMTKSDSGTNVGRSESQDSVGSTHSDISHDRTKIFKMNQTVLQSDSSERLAESKNRSGVNVLPNNQKLSRLLAAMHEGKGSVGVQPGNTKVHDTYFLQGPHSLESSPASSRRHQGSGRISYNNSNEAFRSNFPCGSSSFAPVRTMQSVGSLGKKANYMSSDVLAYSQLTPCMEKLHLTMSDLDQDQDEPINFSTKYVEVAHEPADATPVPASSDNLLNQVVPALRGSGAPQPIVNQQSTSHQVASRMQVHNSTFTSAHHIPPGRMTQPVAIGPVGSGSDANSSGFISKRLMTHACHPSSQGRIIPGYSRYRKPELDLEASEQPINYSIKFAECNEDEHGFIEQPVNYSTRYAEREASSAVALNLPRVQNAAYGFSDDTVMTFCTEGTPMNFLSTATSMNDLSCNGTSGTSRKAEFGSKANEGVVERTKFHLDAECSSVSGSQSTSHNTASTVAVGKPPDDGKNRKTSIEETVYMDQTVQPPNISSVYAYKDSTGTSSPYDKPKQYWTEGTPMYFSNASSLSNLQISEAGTDESPEKQAPLPKPGPKSLPNIDENSTLDGRKSGELKQPTSVNDNGSCAPMSHHISSGTTKTVTFDDNNQIQETPLMFSRCSSLGSLSSFDTHSVHSSVVSEYSRRASEVVSPSDLPDSPCDTMPPSPSYQTRNAKTAAVPADIRKPSIEETKNLTRMESTVNADDKCPEVVQPVASVPLLENTTYDMEQSLQFSALSSPVIYADEGSSCAFSGRTSLSALTIDEDVEIPAKTLPPVVSANKSEEVEVCNAKCLNKEIEKEVEKTVDNDDDDDDDNSSVSEGEENILAEIISRAMPSKSSRRSVHNVNDGRLKKPAMTKCAPKTKQTSSYGPGKTASRSSHGMLPVRSAVPAVHQRAQFFCPAPEISETLMYGSDSPRKYATEDTPLNFSHSGSLGDLSGNSDLANETVIFVEKPPALSQAEVDDNSVVSSLSDSDEDLEQLLSQIIKSAMPQSKKQSSKSAQSEKKSTSNSASSNSKQYEALQQRKVPTQGSTLLVGGYSHFMNTCSDLAADGIRTYETEGTPIKFSRSTSLSNLTIDSLDEGVPERRHTELENNEVRQLPTKVDVQSISEDLVTASCRHDNTLAECISQVEDDARLSLVGREISVDSDCVAKNGSKILSEDVSAALNQSNPFLEFDSGEALEINVSLVEDIEASCASSAQIVKIVGGGTVQPNVGFDLSPRTVDSRVKSGTTGRTVHLSSTPKENSISLKASKAPSNINRISSSSRASASRKPPAGKSRSLSPAARSRQVVKSLTEVQIPSRSNSYNSTCSQPSVVSASDCNAHTPSSVEPTGSAQKSASEVYKFSPQMSLRTSTKPSRNSVPKSSRSPKFDASDAAMSNLTSSKLEDVSVSQNFRASVNTSKYRKPSNISIAGKTSNSGNHQKLTNKSETKKQWNNLESVAVGCDFLTPSDCSKPPIKHATFTKDTSTVECLVIEGIRPEDVGGCNALDSDQGDGVGPTVNYAHKTGIAEMGVKGQNACEKRRFKSRPTLNSDNVDPCKINLLGEAGSYFCVKALSENVEADAEIICCEAAGKSYPETSLEQIVKDVEDKSSSCNMNFGMQMPSKNLSGSQPSMSSVLVKTSPRRGSLTSSVADRVVWNEKISDPSLPSKKQGFAKLSSFWNKDKRTKTNAATNPQEDPSLRQIGTVDPGKSSKSFRKSFHIVRSKKVKREENFDGEDLSSIAAITNNGLVHSRTSDRLDYEPKVSDSMLEPASVLPAEVNLLDQNHSEVLRQGEVVISSANVENLNQSSTIDKDLSTGQKNGKKSLSYPWKRHSEDNSKETSKEFSVEKERDNQRVKSKKLEFSVEKERDNQRVKSKKLTAKTKEKNDVGMDICKKDVAESKASKKKVFSLLRR